MKKNLILAIICSICFCGCINKPIIEESINRLNDSTPQMPSGIQYDNTVLFYYDTQSTLTYEEIVTTEYYGLIKNLDAHYPFTYIHINLSEEMHVDENGVIYPHGYYVDENGQIYLMGYTVLSLENESLLYVTMMIDGTSIGPKILDFILYPFETVENEEFIRELVFEEDLPENILARKI